MSALNFFRKLTDAFGTGPLTDPVAVADSLEPFNALPTPYGRVGAAVEDPDDFYDCCPNCGHTGGQPIYIPGYQSDQTGYFDEFDGCTLCIPSSVWRGRPA